MQLLHRVCDIIITDVEPNGWSCDRVIIPILHHHYRCSAYLLVQWHRPLKIGAVLKVQPLGECDTRRM